MEHALSDAEAIRRSRDQPQAFVAIFERHHAAIHGYLRRRLGADLADDLAAETFARAFRRRASYRPLAETAKPWLFGIAANLIADHRRAEARALHAWQRAAMASPCSVDEQPADIDPQLVIRLRALARRDREALLLLAWGELSYEEIALALDVPLGTVRSRIHRARARLTRTSNPITPTTPGEAHA
jgi:RNA polymerase sigma-70 factor (ECF subfamily)